MTSVKEIKAFTDTIPNFNGNPKQLNYFINRVEEINNLIDGITPPVIDSLKKLSFINIKGKLTDKAAELIQGQNFDSWTSLKRFLVAKFANKQNSSTILLDILYKKCHKKPTEFVEDIIEMFGQYKQKLSLENNNALQIYSQNEKLVVLHTIVSLKDPLRNNLATRNPQTLVELDSLLRNDFQYLKIQQDNQNKPFPNTRLIPGNQTLKFPTKTKFPTGPINLTYNKGFQSTNQGLNKPTPMSISTRNTQVSSWNKPQINKPNNYFTQNKTDKPREWISEELHNANEIPITEKPVEPNHNNYFLEQNCPSQNIT